MNGNTKLAIVIAIAIGVTGVAAFSWTYAQSPAGGDPAQVHDHEHGEEAQPQKDPHVHPPGEVHREDEHPKVDEPDAHEGHDHAKAPHGEEDAQVGEDAHDHAGDDHSDEPSVRLSPEERKAFGIKLATAGADSLTANVRLPGEIVLNADRVAHITPRSPGIVGEVLVSVGDEVHAGQIMAWLESVELGEAKVDFLAKWAEVGCCTIDFTRAEEVHDNTAAFLKALDASPSLEALRGMNGGSMGEYRSDLVSAYAEFVFAAAAHEREKQLVEKKVASQSEFQAVEAAYKKADALYTAKRDSIAFKIRRALLEAKRERQLREMELKGAERRLYVLGLSAEDVKELERVAPQTPGAPPQQTPCSDPNCENCKPSAANAAKPPAIDLCEIEERLARYPLRAPFDGTVIGKHLTLGEKHGDDSTAFTVADLSTVWVNISVYQKDLVRVRKGQAVQIRPSQSGGAIEGVISFVAPIVDARTRTALARVILANPDGQWRPGLFVTAELAVGEPQASIVIPKTAVQRIGEESVVFIDTGTELVAEQVAVGQSDGDRVEILAGLEAGQRYVVEGAFELKAKIVTSGLGAHAGHGH